MHFSFSKLNVFQKFSSNFVNGVDRIRSKDAKMFLKISFNELASFFVHSNGSKESFSMPKQKFNNQVSVVLKVATFFVLNY
jgi:hypothetical protein